MTDNWIGNILLSNGEDVKTDEGETVENLLLCNGDEIDAEKFPRLFSKLPYQWAYTESPHSVEGELTLDQLGSQWMEGDQYLLGSDGYYHIYNSDWVHLGKNIINDGETFVRGICADPSREGQLFIASGGSFREIERVRLSDNTVLDSVSIPSYDVRGIVAYDGVIYTGEAVGTRINKYDYDFNYIESFDRVGSPTTVRGFLKHATGIYVFSTGACYEYTLAWEYIGIVFLRETPIYWAGSGMYEVGSGESVILCTQGNSDVDRLSFSTLPNMTSPDPTCPYRVVADLIGE